MPRCSCTSRSDSRSQHGWAAERSRRCNAARLTAVTVASTLDLPMRRARPRFAGTNVDSTSGRPRGNGEGCSRHGPNQHPPHERRHPRGCPRQRGPLEAAMPPMPIHPTNRIGDHEPRRYGRGRRGRATDRRGFSCGRPWGSEWPRWAHPFLTTRVPLEEFYRPGSHHPGCCVSSNGSSNSSVRDSLICST